MTTTDNATFTLNLLSGNIPTQELMSVVLVGPGPAKDFARNELVTLQMVDTLQMSIVGNTNWDGETGGAFVTLSLIPLD